MRGDVRTPRLSRRGGFSHWPIEDFPRDQVPVCAGIAVHDLGALGALEIHLEVHPLPDRTRRWRSGIGGDYIQEVEERATRPMEKLLWEIPGVEYIYSTSSPGLSMAIVRCGEAAARAATDGGPAAAVAFGAGAAALP